LLPCSKEEIKEAIKLCIGSCPLSEWTALRFGYVLLSIFVQDDDAALAAEAMIRWRWKEEEKIKGYSTLPLSKPLTDAMYKRGLAVMEEEHNESVRLRREIEDYAQTILDTLKSSSRKS
jgi:hypothetical protein